MFASIYTRRTSGPHFLKFLFLPVFYKCPFTVLPIPSPGHLCILDLLKLSILEVKGRAVLCIERGPVLPIFIALCHLGTLSQQLHWNSESCQVQARTRGPLSNRCHALLLPLPHSAPQNKTAQNLPFTGYVICTPHYVHRMIP